ncbi:hypothetical protein ACFUJR_21320 [Streptomyces sp. NPDC057271]|uniref:imidazolonepropionase-like domain-containing protein n=1 Tax=unclassified Streptomyces TaxID=2593676 RepID=UPI003630D2E7
MLTIHAADLVLPGGGHAPVPGGAVVVRDAEIAAVGPYEEVSAAFTQGLGSARTGGTPMAARVRRWPGVLTPALLQPFGPELLEETYHPDPREADELGTEPITGAALDRLGPDESRWGPSARRGLQRMLAHGTVAVAGTYTRPAVQEAVRRSGLITAGRASAPAGVPALDPYATGGPVVHTHVLLPGNHARFAVFGVADEAELLARGASTCVATVLGGRLLYRSR